LSSKIYQKYQNTIFLLIVILLLGSAMSIITSGRFLTFSTIQSLLFQLPELGLLTLAMMVPVLTGGINLSIIATANLTGVLVAFFYRSFNLEQLGSTETILIFIDVVLIMLNGRSRGRWKNNMDAILALIWLSCLIISYFLFGWKISLTYLIGSFIIGAIISVIF